jgi:hypothetical protein
VSSTSPDATQQARLLLALLGEIQARIGGEEARADVYERSRVPHWRLRDANEVLRRVLDSISAPAGRSFVEVPADHDAE